MIIALRQCLEGFVLALVIWCNVLKKIKTLKILTWQNKTTKKSHIYFHAFFINHTALNTKTTILDQKAHRVKKVFSQVQTHVESLF